MSVLSTATPRAFVRVRRIPLAAFIIRSRVKVLRPLSVFVVWRAEVGQLLLVEREEDFNLISLTCIHGVDVFLESRKHRHARSDQISLLFLNPSQFPTVHTPLSPEKCVR